MIKILLVDDQALLCEVLKTWLDVEKDIQVLGVAHDGQKAIEAVEELQPDIVLMDIDMPQMNGLKATEIISRRFPQVKVIFLSGHDDDVYLGKSLRAGAKGYLLKNTTAEELVQKIRSVYDEVNLLESIPNDSSLVAIQAQLEELLETYRLKFDNLLKQHDSVDLEYFERIEQKLEQRLSELESSLDTKDRNQLKELEQKNQLSWKSVRQEIINVNSQFHQANRNLSTQFNQQISNLRQDLDKKLSSALDDWSRQRAALQEWAVQRDEMRPSLEDYEVKNRQELMSLVDPMKASFKDMDRQLRTMRNLLVASGLFSLIALAIAGYVLLSYPKSEDSVVVPQANLVEH
jgi:YesN/AraC family two-component response regulator